MNGLAALLALALAQEPQAAPAAPAEPAEKGAPAPAETAPEPPRPRPPEPPRAEPPAPPVRPPAPPAVQPPSPSGRAHSVSPAPTGGEGSTERAQVAAAAAKFFAALLARRAAELTALSSPGFSFEGRAARGPEDVRSRWDEAVARHDGVAYALLDLVVLPAPEAVARFGKPPKRLAALAQPGSWVAVASLSGRPTFVFFARQGGAWLATGMHD